MTENVQKLADYAISRHYPSAMFTDAPYLELLRVVVHKQAELIAQWMSLGFIHGVLNTDNVAISAETLDYGPCAFMDTYHPDTVFSSIDTMGRYAYGNQPDITYWNLARLAESLLPLIDDNKPRAVEQAKPCSRNSASTMTPSGFDAWAPRLDWKGLSKRTGN